MKKEVLEKVQEEIASCKYIQDLPSLWHGFTYKSEKIVEDDMYDIFSYTNKKAHRKIIIYYHSETKEYKLRIRIGSFEFCHIECIAESLEIFEKILRQKMEDILSELETFKFNSIDYLVHDKNILKWKYQEFLPEKMENMELFIEPSQPICVTNGSFIIADYEDFSSNSSFMIFYNIFRDEFYCETRILGKALVNYQFDSLQLSDLENKLKKYLPRHLKMLHEKIKSGKNPR